MSNRYSNIFSIFRPIFLKIHHRNNCDSLFYILRKLDPQILESRQVTAKSFDSNFFVSIVQAKNLMAIGRFLSSK